MFTGIIEKKAVIIDLSRDKQQISLSIKNHFKAGQCALGDSVALNGVCLTVKKISQELLSFDVSPETLACTTLNTLNVGDEVNLELPLSLEKPLGGHIVLGHVDDVVIVDTINRHDAFIEIVFSGFNRPEWLVEKGSIAINGISLTINAILNGRVSCMIIPHTSTHTTLGTLTVNDQVNIEYDYVAKIVTRQNTLKTQYSDEEVINVN